MATCPRGSLPNNKALTKQAGDFMHCQKLRCCATEWRTEDHNISMPCQTHKILNCKKLNMFCFAEVFPHDINSKITLFSKNLAV